MFDLRKGRKILSQLAGAIVNVCYVTCDDLTSL
jgi:hypothetical protein